MRKAKPRIVRAEVLLILMATGCSGIAEQPPQQTSARYQLQTDRNGNVFRLDTSTGEVTNVAAERDGRRKAPRIKRAQVDEPSTAAAPTPLVTPEPESGVQAITSSPVITNACDRTASTLSASLTVSAAAADVFINAVREQAPMTRLAKGTLLTTMGSQDEWILVRFADPQWGQRAGYVHCSQVIEALDP